MSGEEKVVATLGISFIEFWALAKKKTVPVSEARNLYFRKRLKKMKARTSRALACCKITCEPDGTQVILPSRAPNRIAQSLTFWHSPPLRPTYEATVNAPRDVCDVGDQIEDHRRFLPGHAEARRQRCRFCPMKAFAQRRLATATATWCNREDGRSKRPNGAAHRPATRVALALRAPAVGFRRRGRLLKQP
jgi:hypothetical protein